MREQDILDFAPGEREAVAQMAQDSSKVSLALRSAKRRWRKIWLIASAGLFLWALYCLFMVKWLTRLLTGWEYQSGWGLPLCGLPGIIVGLVVYYYNCSRRCIEIGGRLQIKRLKLSKKVINAFVVLVALWMLLLATFYANGSGADVLRNEILPVVWLTEFVLTLLGYLTTVFSLSTFSSVSHKQIIREEKWALGIFD